MSTNTRDSYEGVPKYTGNSNIVLDVEHAKVETTDCNGLRISPSKLIFLDTYVGQIYLKKITFQNVCNHKIVLRILRPYSLAFKVSQEGKWIFLPPGIKTSAKIYYRCAKNKSLKSSVPILINDVKYEIPLEVLQGEAKVKVYPKTLDFGVLDVGCPFVSKTIFMDNEGVCPTMFAVDFATSNLQLVAYPKIGRIGAYKSKSVKVVMTCFIAGEYKVEMWVKTEPLESVLIKAIFIKPYLSALHPLTTGDFTLIDFLPTLEETVRRESLIIRNVSSRISSFTVLAEVGTTEIMTLERARGTDVNFTYFSIDPLEGRMGPFEGRIFTAIFHPTIIHNEKGWKHKGDTNTKEYLAFLRLIRVEVVDTEKEAPKTEKDGAQSTLTDESLDTRGKLFSKPTSNVGIRQQADQIILRLCLHGLAMKPMLEIVPDLLTFDVDVGCIATKVLSFKNITPSVVLGYRITKTPFLDVIPPICLLQPMQRVEALVRLKAFSLGSQNTLLTIEIVAPKEVSDDSRNKKIGSIDLKIKINVRSKVKEPKPRFNMGISPNEVVHEVGTNIDRMTFRSILEGEKAPIFMPKTTKPNKRPWLNSRYTIAVPNDRGLSFATKPYDRNMLTPFTGKRRYIPPVDSDYAYTEEVVISKKQHDDKYRMFMLRLGRERRADLIEKEAFVNEYDYKLDRRLFDKIHMYDDVVDITFDSVFKEVVRYSDLCPLSPLSLFNIKVQPKNLDFGLVPPGVDVTNYITVENNNKFAVAVKLITQKVGIIIPEPAFRVKPYTSITKPIMIHLKNNGKFFSNLNYIINTHHMFDLKVTAEAIRRTLQLSQTVINFPKPAHEEIFQLRCVPINIVNPLSVPTSFCWKLPPLTAFKVLPNEGTIGGLHSISCTIYYELNTKHFASSTISLVVVKGPTITVQCNAPEDAGKLSLFNSKVYCPSISLGLPFIEEVLLFNPNHRDAVFFVQNTNPVEGVNIRPACGIIKARACFVLTLVFTMNCVTMFDFRVNIDVNAKSLLYFKVNGFVIYPKVKFSPPSVNFKIIPCYSYETASVEMQNESNAPALVTFAMEPAFQMKLSLTKHVREPGLLSDGISIPPNSGKKIYLHFLPRELSSYVFYLPTIVNNIVGPPTFKDEKSLLTTTYIKRGEKCQSNKCNLLDMPETLSTVKIDCTTVNALITFSHFELNFVKKGNIRELQLLKVKNQLDCMMKLWFDYEQIFKSPFQIMKNNKSVKVIKLQPFEEIVLHTYFCPTKPGTYIADLPVYISSKKKAVFYNIIRFTGIYHKSSLYCSEQLIYFLPMPLNIEAERSIFIIANHQQKKTDLIYSKFVVSGEFDDHNIWCDFPKGTQIIPGIENFTIPVTVKFCSSKALSAIVALKFSDGCDGICKVGICFTAENCILTTYAFSFLSSLPAEGAAVIDVSETSEGSVDKDSPPHSESDLVSSRRDRVDSTKKTRGSMEERSSSIESKQLRGSLMDHISDSLKRKASYQNRTRSNDSDPEKVSKPSLGHSDTIEQEDDNLEEGSEDLKRQYLRVLAEIEQYPLFPCDVSDTLYAVYMRREEEFVEQWVYEQGFQCSFRMHIGEDIFNSKSFQKCLVSRSKSYQSSIRSLLDLVLKLSGRELEMVYAASTPLPEDDRERVTYCLKIYNQIIIFLINQGALMEHVFPFYLLSYDDYLIYYKEIMKSNVLFYSPEEFEIKSDRIMLDKEKFERLSHQCWLDLFLQLFKVLLLSPIQSMLANSSSIFDSRISAVYNLDKYESKSEDLRGKYDIRSSILLTNVNTENTYHYSANENILLNWMNYIFELKRNKWNAKDKSLCVPARKITNFTADLRDGVVLTAVTTYYCPYLIQELQNFYYKPITEAEYLHNAQLLTLVWWNIRLGLVITPLHFQRTNQITMTFIVTHLYYSLRSYVPRSSLKLTASLSTIVNRKLSISNPSDSKIRFILYKIGDINDCFDITKPHTITIASKQKISLVLSYFAKRLFKVKCVLMFCGSCMAGNYANNLVFEVEAEPNKLELQSHYVINVPIYRTVFINIKLTSPYDNPAIYDIWYTEHEPVPGNVIIYKWSNIKDIKIPRMLYIGCSQISVPSLHTRPATLPLVVACFSLGVNYFWLIFSNDSMGDFIIKLTLTPRYDYEHDVFKVDLPSEECLGVPTALCSANCPRLLHINVPSRNARFWETLKTMLFFTLTDKEKKFWNSHLETTIGLKLIKWMIGEVKDSGCKTMADIFNPKITFNLQCDSELVEMQSTLTVNDVHADTTIPIPVHIRSQVSSSFSVKLEMISEDEAEVRVYKIEFELQVPNNPSDNA